MNRSVCKQNVMHAFHTFVGTGIHMPCLRKVIHLKHRSQKHLIVIFMIHVHSLFPFPVTDMISNLKSRTFMVLQAPSKSMFTFNGAMCLPKNTCPYIVLEYLKSSISIGVSLIIVYYFCLK